MPLYSPCRTCNDRMKEGNYMQTVILKNGAEEGPTARQRDDDVPS